MDRPLLWALDPVLRAELGRKFSHPPAANRYLVGYSGGRDSLAELLLALEFLPGGRVSALHIHHGLQEGADEWAALCRHNCEQLGIACELVRVTVSGIAEKGMEAAAREARYQAFSTRLQQGDCLLLGHHLEDQAETVLLRLLRGAGPDGLQAMPANRSLGHGVLWRPLLETPLAKLRAVAGCSGLCWVDDPGNSAGQSDRGYLRSHVLPSIAARWPGFRSTLTRAARHCHTAVAARDCLQAPLLAELSDADGSLDLAALDQYPDALLTELLRAWLQQQQLPMPHARSLRNLCRMMRWARPDSAPLASWPGVRIRRFAGRLYALRDAADDIHDYAIDWRGGKSVELPGTLGRLRLDPGELASDGWNLKVTSRRGGERFRPFSNGPSRRLKQFYQEHRVPPWERAGIPLLWHDGAVVALGDHWINDAFARQLAESGLRLRWIR